MKNIFLFVFTSFCMTLISVVSTGQEQPQLEKSLGSTGVELVPSTYELYYNGKNLYMELNHPTRVEPVPTPKDGKTLLSLRFSPYQRVKMNTLQYLYPYPARAFDDKSGTYRVTRIYSEKGYAMTITDFGGTVDNPEAIKKALDILIDSAKSLLVDKDKLEKPEIVTINFAPKLENVTVTGTRVQFRIRYDEQVKDQDGNEAVADHNKIYETIVMTISGKDFFATLVIQMFDHPFSKDIQDDILFMLKSFESVE